MAERSVGTIIGGMGAGVQKFWQRVFAFSEGKAFKGYLLGAQILLDHMERSKKQEDRS